jgi:hypothetical protein
MSDMVPEAGVAVQAGKISIIDVTRRLEEQRQAFDGLKASLNSLRERLSSK